MTSFNKCTRIPIHTLTWSILLFSHSHTHTRSNTYSQCCLYNSISVLRRVWQEGAVDNGLPLSSTCLTFWTHAVMKSCPMKHVQALSLTLRLSPARSLSDVWPINNPPSLPVLVDSLLSLLPLLLLPSPIVLLLSLPSSLLFLSPSSHSLHSFPLAHFSSLSLSHALSRWNSAVSPHRCRIGSNAHKRARNENTARYGKQAGGGERGAEEGEDSSSVLWQPQIEENQRKAWAKKPGEDF